MKFHYPIDTAIGAEYPDTKEDTSIITKNIPQQNTTCPYVGLAVDKTGDELFGLPVAHLKPGSFTVTVQEKKKENNIIPGTVTINIQFVLDEVEMIDKVTDDLRRAITANRRGYLGFKEYSYSEKTGKYEIETKKMPKLVLKPAGKNTSEPLTVEPPLVLTRTIESNDTTVKVSSSFMIKGQVGPGFYRFSNGLKVRIIQKILGDYIVGGLRADDFKVFVTPHYPGFVQTPISVDIAVDLQNAEINYTDEAKDSKLQNPEWQELLQQSLIAYFAFDGRPEIKDGNKVYTIAAVVASGSNDSTSVYKNNNENVGITANFSFSIVDGR